MVHVAVHEANISCIAEEFNAIPLNRLAYLSCSGESWFVYVTSLPCTCPHVQCIYVLVVYYIFGTHVTGTDTISQSVESYFMVVDHVGLAQAYPKRALVVDLH